MNATSKSNLALLNISTDSYKEEASLNLRDACKLMKGRKDHPAVEVVRRWINRGVHPRRGEELVLFFPALWACGEYRTMPEWVAAFVNTRSRLAASDPKKRTPTEKQRMSSLRRAHKKLKEAGIM